MKLYSVLSRDGYPFDNLEMVTDVVPIEDYHDLKKDGILVLWGGGDIPPEWYGKGRSSHSHAPPKPNVYDKIEWNSLHRAMELKIPIIGICRGAQFLCAATGGYLIQDMYHPHEHEIEDGDGNTFITNSCHHQMMVPVNNHTVDYVAWTKPAQSPYYMDVDKFGDDFNNKDILLEPEYLYFNEIKGHAIQWHPEWMDKDSEATQFIFNFIKETL